MGQALAEDKKEETGCVHTLLRIEDVQAKRDKLCCIEEWPSERSIRTYREINGRVITCKGFYLMENK